MSTGSFHWKVCCCGRQQTRSYFCLSHVDEHSLFEICESKVRTHRFNDGLLVNDSEFWFGLMSVSQPDLGASGSLVLSIKVLYLLFNNDYIIPNGPIINPLDVY